MGIKYIVCLDVVNGVPTTYLARWKGDPGRTCIRSKAKRYASARSATYALANARKYGDFPNACILEVAA